eukprot:Gb_41446 [translate_table: standard]
MDILDEERILLAGQDEYMVRGNRDPFYLLSKALKVPLKLKTRGILYPNAQYGIIVKAGVKKVSQSFVKARATGFLKKMEHLVMIQNRWLCTRTLLTQKIWARNFHPDQRIIPPSIWS